MSHKKLVITIFIDYNTFQLFHPPTCAPFAPSFYLSLEPVVPWGLDSSNLTPLTAFTI